MGARRSSEPRVLRATGLIVTLGVWITGVITAFALFRPSAFETGRIARPSGDLDATAQIALQKARLDARNSARETGLKVAQVSGLSSRRFLLGVAWN